MACCETFKDYARHDCDKHDAFECPDTLFVMIGDTFGWRSAWGLAIKDGGESYVPIDFCPFCGKVP